MSSNSSNVSDFLTLASVSSTLLLICTAFSLFFVTEDAENFKRCVQRAQTSTDECALIIYGR
jgi:hypothetical protein